MWLKGAKLARLRNKTIFSSWRFCLAATICEPLVVCRCESTFADEILAVMNLAVTEPFIQVVQLTNRKVPTVILYGPRQLHEIRSFCFDARRGSILSLDKTYNLGSLFVTVSTYVNMALRRLNTGDSPVFIGPLFLHGNSDASTFHSFFGHLRGCFGDKPLDQLDQLRIGSDDEIAIRKSMSQVFKESSQVTCTQHLKVRKEPIVILAFSLGIYLRKCF